MSLLFNRITIQKARILKLNRAAPILYRDWYTYADRIEDLLKMQMDMGEWCTYKKELRDTSDHYVEYGLQKEAGLLLTTEKKQVLMINQTSPERYMTASLLWLSLPTSTGTISATAGRSPST
jgi:hypothetical protein